MRTTYENTPHTAQGLPLFKHHMPRWETNGVFFALNQTIQSTEEVRTNSMENNIQHRCKYCLDMWTIVLEMLFQIWYH